MPTPDGEFHVKFARPDAEATHAPINELLAARLIEHLNGNRPVMAIVEIPDALRKADPDLAPILSPNGFGVRRMEGATDASDAILQLAAESAPEDELFAEFVVLTWLQNGDHGGGNWMIWGERVIAVDFASSPSDAVWSGGTLQEARVDHGSLRARIDRVEDHVRSEVCRRAASLTASGIAEMMSEAPSDWATADERRHVTAELERTKEALLAEFQQP
jgi:hypothetical protein